MSNIAVPNPDDWNSYVEQKVMFAEPSTSNGWFLWLFLGGLGAHLAWLWPRSRAITLTVSIVLFFVTFGISGLCLWLFSWPVLLGAGALEQRRDMARARIIDDILRRRALG